MSTQHTPGPWVVADPDASPVTVTTDQRLADSIVEIATVETDFYRPDSAFVEEQKANARLIAAAPELLEALTACECILNGIGGWDKTHALVRAAISKATQP